MSKAVKDFEKRFCRSTMDRLGHATRSRLEDPGAGGGADEGAGGDGAVAGGGRSHFTEPVPLWLVKSPPCSMNCGITRWNVEPA